MKKFLFSLFLGSVLLFVGCSKDNNSSDNNNNNNNNSNTTTSLTGKTWGFNGVVMSVTFSNTQANNIFKPFLDVINQGSNVADPEVTVKFNTNGTWESYNPEDGKYGGTYSVNGNILTVNDGESTDVCTYSISNNILTMTYDSTNDPDARESIEEMLSYIIDEIPEGTTVTKITTTMKWKAK